MTETYTELRSVQMVDFDVSGMEFRGKAAVFDQPWDPALTEKFGYEETVKRGAFIPALAASVNVPLLREHDPHQLLATTAGGTLHTIKEDGDALIVHATLPPTPLGEETRALIERGDLRGMSYGVQSDRSGSRLHRENGVMKRTITAFRRMLDVSITWDPAYRGTSAELRSFSAVTLDDLGMNVLPDADLSGWDARIRAIEIETLTGGYRAS